MLNCAPNGLIDSLLRNFQLVRNFTLASTPVQVLVERDERVYKVANLRMLRVFVESNVRVMQQVLVEDVQSSQGLQNMRLTGKEGLAKLLCIHNQYRVTIGLGPSCPRLRWPFWLLTAAFVVSYSMPEGCIGRVVRRHR